MTLTLNRPPQLDSHHPITDEQIARFREQGFITLKEVFTADELEAYRQLLRNAVQAGAEQRGIYAEPIEQRSVYDQAFMQVMNIWRREPGIIPLVFSRRLARLASELLGTRGVRLYHDQALYKEPGGGFTPWHVDQVYWPLASELSVTAWIPLVPVSREMGPLEFAAGSQGIMEHREMKISAESEAAIDRKLKLSRLPVHSEPFDLGEISFHYGYTFHRAGPNRSERMREVMTVIYIDKDMRLRSDQRSQGDKAGWCPGIGEGEVISSYLNPVLYETA